MNADFFVCPKCGEAKTMQRYVTVDGHEGTCYDCYSKQPKNVCIDFDAVIAEYDGWKGPDHLGQPAVGVRMFLRSVWQLGFRVIVFSTRNPNSIAQWLLDHDLAVLVSEITDKKVPAVAYIDDRGICHRGDFNETLDQLRNFRPYWK